MKNMIKEYIENINEIGGSKGVLSIFLLYIVNDHKEQNTQTIRVFIHFQKVHK